MKKLIIYISCVLFYSSSFACDKNTVFVPESKMSFELISCDSLQGRRINVLVKAGKQTLKYGEWIVRYNNGKVKSKGSFSFTIRPVCGVGRPYPSSYRQIITGKWEYFNINGSPRYDLYDNERPWTGNYKCFHSENKVLYEEGYYEEGKMINGKFYNHKMGPEAKDTVVNVYENGRWVRYE